MHGQLVRWSHADRYTAPCPDSHGDNTIWPEWTELNGFPSDFAVVFNHPFFDVIKH
jgi:hypothetical protein